MTKLRIVLVAVSLLAAFTLTRDAYALTDLHCAGNPYDNTPLIRGFQVETPDSSRQHDVSAVSPVWLACGSDLGAYGEGAETLYDHFEVELPPGVEVAGTDGHEGEYVAGAGVSVLYSLGGAPGRIPDDPGERGVPTRMRANPGGKRVCIGENSRLEGGPTPGALVACYQAVGTAFWGAMFQGWSWVTDDSGQLRLTIGLLHPIKGTVQWLGPTAVEMELCGWFGGAAGPCPQSGDRMQRNGDASILGCPGGRGLYSITATRRDGLVTAPASYCVEWSATKARPMPRRPSG